MNALLSVGTTGIPLIIIEKSAYEYGLTLTNTAEREGWAMVKCIKK